MKTSVDDWHFRPSQDDLLVLDAFLSNGQHALLEVSPMQNRNAPNGDIPEMVVFCEFPGEKIAEHNCTARWITRPRGRDCPGSNVQTPPALMQQTGENLALPATPVASAA